MGDDVDGLPRAIPLILSSFAIYAIPALALQLAAAAALRWNGSSRGWVAFIVLSGIIWMAVLFSARFTTAIWIGPIPLLPLGLLALLWPLLPIGMLTREGISR